MVQLAIVVAKLVVVWLAVVLAILVVSLTALQSNCLSISTIFLSFCWVGTCFVLVSQGLLAAVTLHPGLGLLTRKPFQLLDCNIQPSHGLCDSDLCPAE